ncbi:MAG: M20/M25/M40 family metallo-hydrolase, partial [Cyanobacteria bacterium HKST-UBA04]|nr:M20/M25/M40 family metallo-hydrolase [Cyanobacteria bacterium HKST-UBA04]
TSVREHLKTSLNRIAASVAQLHNARITVDFQQGTPAVINTPAAAIVARQAACVAVGERNVMPLQFTNMGAEDFGYYLQHVPGCYVRFGAQIEGKEGFPAHSSKFDFDEQALLVGAAYYHQVALAAAQALRDG